MQPQLQEALSKGWKSTCRAVFRTEIGELGEFEPYLREAAVGKEVESSFSGKRLWVVSRQYAPHARFFDFGAEHGKLAGLKRDLDINRIKDIDSLLESLRETFVYSGNKVLGNSKNVEYSDSIVDSTFAYGSSTAIGCKCLAFSGPMQHSECAFGSTSSGQSANIIRCFYNNSLKRCFEVCATVKASDSYFSYNIWSCTDCMFSFNLRNRSHVIANIQLRKDQYQNLKEKLMGEIAGELKGRKRLDYSIIDIVNGGMGSPAVGREAAGRGSG